MGVFGLWRLLESTGKPVPLETLEGKVLAIDVSIWIYQVLQGYQDRHGNSKPNAHLLGLYHRICKLLYYKIKPVFVFDGGVPMLKKNTIAARRKQKTIACSKAQKMKADLINNLIKHAAVKTVLNTDTIDKNSINENLSNKDSINDIFKLPAMPCSNNTEDSLSDEYDSDSSVTLSPRKQTKWLGNIHNVDVTSADFRALPADVRYDILTDLKETRKQNSWGRLHEMPEESNDFSGFQMKRLLKRRLVQESLESAEQEMGGKTLTLEELDKLLTEQGISTKGRDAAYRIAGDSTTRVLYISDKNEFNKNKADNENSPSEDVLSNKDKETEVVAGPSKTQAILNDMNEYQLNDDWDSDIELTENNDFMMEMENISEYGIDSDMESEIEMDDSRQHPKTSFEKNMNPALAYMIEHSGLTQHHIQTILEQNKKNTNKISEKKSKIFKWNKPKAEEHKVEQAQTAGTVDSETISNPPICERHEEDCKIIEKAAISNSPTCSSVAVKSEEIALGSTSDSGSDDFIEIKDVLIPDTNSNIKDVSKEGIQITFRSDQKIEDDMFADIFKTEHDDTKAALSSQSTKETDDTDVKLAPKLVDKQIEKNDSEKQCRENKTNVNDTVVPLEKSLLQKEEPSDIHKAIDTEITVPQDAISLDTSINDAKKCTETIIPQDAISLDTSINDAKKCTETIIPQDAISLDTSINDTEKLNLPTNKDELLSLKVQLETDQENLAVNIRKFNKQATDITDEIRKDAQELLQLFGIPYIVAPMEAEAQCAYLEQFRLTDGTITDDSDIWLFGGQCVYKNFFNNNKRVLRFLSGDIKHHFKLTRNEMIQLALLVGSDYTSGLTGIGPVTALEILAAFPAQGDNVLNGLINFSSWMKSGKIVGPGRTSLRNKVRNVEIEKGFPSQAVVQAYLFPTVDESKENFTWGKLNNTLLSDYAKLKFGWNREKFGEIMAPVLKKLEEAKTQRGIDTYFKVQTAIPKSIETNLSKRVQKAVKRLNNADVEDSLIVDDVEKQTKQRKPKSVMQKKEKISETVVDNLESNDVPNTIASTSINKNVEEYIPQREKDKAEALKKKLHAIEVMRKSKQGLCKTKKVKRCVRKVKKEAELSESDSSSS